jgi:hypothetical protein
MTTRGSGRKAQRNGETLEQMVEVQARANGWAVQRIATPFRLSRGRVVYTAKVVGDLVGCTATGRAILIECKSRQAAKTKANPTGAGYRKPRLSDFEPHQLATLQEWDNRGALVLVAWIDGHQLRMDRATSLLWGVTEDPRHADEYHPTTQIIRKK